MKAPDNDRHDDPLAPLVAAVIVGTLLAGAVLFVVVMGGQVSPAAAGRLLKTVGPWYLGLVATLLLARWLGNRKRR